MLFSTAPLNVAFAQESLRSSRLFAVPLDYMFCAFGTGTTDVKMIVTVNRTVTVITIQRFPGLQPGRDYTGILVF